MIAPFLHYGAGQPLIVVSNPLHATLRSYTYVFDLAAPSSTTWVQLYINGAPSGGTDKSRPFTMTRTLDPGTYSVKADLTPRDAQRTFTEPITVVTP